MGVEQSRYCGLFLHATLALISICLKTSTLKTTGLVITFILSFFLQNFFFRILAHWLKRRHKVVVTLQSDVKQTAVSFIRY